MQTYIESCKKEPERRVVYTEHNTEHFENVANITANSDSVILQEKQTVREEDHKIPYNKNEANESIEQNAGETIEQNANTIIEQNERKTIKSGKSFEVITCLNNIVEEKN